MLKSRFEKRNLYIEGWYELDGNKLVEETREDFVFEDPRESFPIQRSGLVDYMYRWDKWTRLEGARNEWRLDHEVRQDKDGILIDWEWWELVGTPICGMAFVKTSDLGVYLEKITYFDRLKYQTNN